MKLPAASYSAEVVTSATKAGSCGVLGEGEYSQPGYFLCFFAAALAGGAFCFAFAFGLAFDFEMAGRDLAFAGAGFGADFACLSFAGTGFTGAVFLPWLPDPPFTGFPSAS